MSGRPRRTARTPDRFRIATGAAAVALVDGCVVKPPTDLEQVCEPPGRYLDD